MDAQDVANTLRITQLAQLIAGLATVIMNATAAGKDTATTEEIAASFGAKDQALGELAAAIVRAKAEGR